MEASEIKRKVEHLQKNPEIFLTKIIGHETLEGYHKRLCKEVIENDRLAIKACHAVGKTWLMGNIVLWFLSCFKNSIIITTAPTNRQVETLLWGEIRKAHRRSKTRLGGKVLNKKITIDDDWYAMGFSPTSSASDSDEQQGSSFQGFHAKYIMIIFDEATGISKDMYTMAEGLLTSGIIVKFICIANPTSTTSEFFRICKKSEWRVVTINCFDSPNMIANGFIDRNSLQDEINHLRTLSDYDRMKRIKSYKKPNGYLLNAQWAVSKLYDWGFEHPLAKSKILGEFPDKSDNVIVKWENIQKAMNREPVFTYEKRYIGVDVARYGDDLTVLTEITDNTVRSKSVHMLADTTETCGHIMNMLNSANMHKETHIVIDATGVGSGVVDILREMKRDDKIGENVFIHEVHYGMRIRLVGDDEVTKTKETKLNNTYSNLKAYIFDLLNKDLENNLSLPNEEIYEEELPSIMFKFTSKGLLAVESKEDFKSRTGKSPDTSDSLVLANYGRYLQPSHMPFYVTKENKGYSKAFEEKKIQRDYKTKIKVKEY